MINVKDRCPACGKINNGKKPKCAQCGEFLVIRKDQDVDVVCPRCGTSMAEDKRGFSTDVTRFLYFVIIAVALAAGITGIVRGEILTGLVSLFFIVYACRAFGAVRHESWICPRCGYFFNKNKYT